MELIIGGACQGKLEYALTCYLLKKEQAVSGRENRKELLFQAALVNQFHLFVRSCLEEASDPFLEAGILLEKNPGVILIADEVGYGIVPADPFEREYRETTGRVMCQMAEKAERVVRVVCGIGMVIK